MRKPNILAIALAVLLPCALALADAPNNMPVPGTLNYMEGSAYINGRVVSPNSVGTEALTSGEILETHKGKAEVLLTPGVFLRLGENTQVRMVSPSLADTEIALVRGQVIIEADNFNKYNRLIVDQGNATTHILKKGLYLVYPEQPFVEVFKGEARVVLGNTHVKVKEGHEAVMEASGRLKSREFDRDIAKNGSLYRWSRLRSEYEAQANMEVSQNIGYFGTWYGPGWYWDQGLGFWSFIPGGGVLYSPFGWGFYPPPFIYGAPLYYGYGFYGHGGHERFGRGEQRSFTREPGGLHRGFAGGGFGNRGFAGSLRQGGGFRGGFGGGGLHGRGR
jgi:hypothetical protein